MRKLIFILLTLINFNLKSQDLILQDISICPGDYVQISFPSGDFSSYSNFAWFFEGQYFSNDSNISIFSVGTYELQLYNNDTLFSQFELNYFD